MIVNDCKDETGNVIQFDDKNDGKVFRTEWTLFDCPLISVERQISFSLEIVLGNVSNDSESNHIVKFKSETRGIMNKRDSGEELIRRSQQKLDDNVVVIECL